MTISGKAWGCPLGPPPHGWAGPACLDAGPLVLWILIARCPRAAGGQSSAPPWGTFSMMASL